MESQIHLIDKTSRCTWHSSGGQITELSIFGSLLNLCFPCYILSIIFFFSASRASHKHVFCLIELTSLLYRYFIFKHDFNKSLKVVRSKMKTDDDDDDDEKKRKKKKK